MESGHDRGRFSARLGNGFIRRMGVLAISRFKPADRGM
jgi:hypothetical protein